jgi:hypothetical protein
MLSTERRTNPRLKAALRVFLATASIATVVLWRDAVALFHYQFPV